ncbi:MAG: hypothetical protein GQ527_08035 [Bacteroidales bacterium]|nr:hypothetical protein [Bacteroidales bacterium]
MKLLILFTSIILLVSSCNTEESNQKTPSSQTTYKDALKRMNTNIHTVQALEVIQSGTYTYVRLKENNKEFWAAISARPIEMGMNYYYKDAFEMKDFQSKSLDRVFESIWFINEFYSEKPVSTNQKSPKHQEKKVANTQDVSVEKANGGYSLAEIFKGKDQLKNQQIIVKGQVVKINPNIMKTNWVHIQDGTSYNDIFDLTITLNEEISFQLGDIITFEGKLILNKDFGAGYRYDYLLENAITK